jgi:hypothetical protein
MTDAEWTALLARASTLPSWPDLAAHLTALQRQVTELSARIEALEQACTALRQEALQQFWRDEP